MGYPLPVAWVVRPTLGVLVLLATGGCGAGWRRSEPMPAGALPARQQVQVWTSGQAVRLHGVTVGADSVSGVPFVRPLSCDSCRVTIPLATVDSLRLGNPMDAFWGTTALAAVITLAVLCRLRWCEAGGT
jgi:hypothetical protein